MKDLAMVHESVDESDDPRGVGEHVVLLGEGLVGGDEDGFVGAPSVDDLEQQIGVAVAVGQISHLIE